MLRTSPALKRQAAMPVAGADTGRGRAGTDAEPDRRPVARTARGHARRGALSRAARFWLVAGVLFLLLFVSGPRRRCMASIRLSGGSRRRR
jgi:hypothetical protein